MLAFIGPGWPVFFTLCTKDCRGIQPKELEKLPLQSTVSWFTVADSTLGIQQADFLTRPRSPERMVWRGCIKFYSMCGDKFTGPLNRCGESCNNVGGPPRLLGIWMGRSYMFLCLFFVLQRAFFFCTVSGCGGGNRNRNIAAYTWRFSLLSYGRHLCFSVFNSFFDAVMLANLAHALSTKGFTFLQVVSALASGMTKSWTSVMALAGGGGVAKRKVVALALYSHSKLVNTEVVT